MTCERFAERTVISTGIVFELLSTIYISTFFKVRVRIVKLLIFSNA